MCFRPLHGFVIGQTENGKPKYKIESGDINWIRCGKDSDTPGMIKYNYIEIPCGKCIGCRLAYSRDWANRCMLEAMNYKQNYFITLTYNEENIPLKDMINMETGEVSLHGTLIKKDLSDFFKRLRRHFEYNHEHEGIRFYGCGEYGSQTDRPHYHAIVFNLPLNDLELLCKTPQGNKIYISETIEKIWGKGNVSIGAVTWETCAYTARYIMKKQKGDTSGLVELHDGALVNLEPEFTQMSRRPGIAKDYYEENKEKIYKNDEIIVTGKKGLAEKIKPSKYYDRMYDLENPEYMKAIKERRRKSAENAMEIALSKTSLNKKEYLELKERSKKEAIKKLVRKAI